MLFHHSSIRTFEKFRARRGRQPNQFEFNAKIALEKGKNEQNGLNSTQSNGNLFTKWRKALCTECYIFNVHLPSPNRLKRRELAFSARALVAHSFTFNFNCPNWAWGMGVAQIIIYNKWFQSICCAQLIVSGQLIRRKEIEHEKRHRNTIRAPNSNIMNTCSFYYWHATIAASTNEELFKNAANNWSVLVFPAKARKKKSILFLWFPHSLTCSEKIHATTKKRTQ